MLILAIDTCFARCAACLYDSAAREVLSGEDVNMERGHAEQLAPMVQRILNAVGRTADQLNRIAVTTGPGTFTGLRIGLSFAKAMAQALDIQIVGIDTLQALKLAALDQNKQALIAHKAGNNGHVYISHSHNSANIEILKLEDLAPYLHPTPELLLGTGADDIESHFKDLKLNRQPENDLPNLKRMAHFATEQQPSKALPEPVYIREPDAKPQSLAKLSLRRAEPADLKHMAELHQACFDQGWSAHNLSEMFATLGTTAILTEQSGRILAFAILRQMFDEAEILTLVTSPHARKQGHATALIKAAKAQGMAKLHLEVAASNTPAQALYVKNGFAPSGLRKAYYAKSHGPAEDAILMVWQPT
jgi:tRNA threonylcarbamoyladenosine biosynthesis protein TsaB